jgi:hypothetical protein
MLGKNEEAKQVLTKALDLNFRPFDSYYLLGMAHERLGDVKEAEIAYKKAKTHEAKKSGRTQATSNKLILIGGLVMSLFIGLISIPPIKIYFKTGMRGKLLQGTGGMLFASGTLVLTIWYISFYSLNKANPLAESISLIILLVILMGGLLNIVGFLTLSTIESGLLREVYSKTTFWKRITGEVPILTLEKIPPPLISKRTGLILGITTMTLGGFLILLHTLFTIPNFTMHFFVSGTFAFIFGLLLIIFSFIFLDKRKKLPKEKVKI